MVSKKKIEALKELKEKIKDHSVIGIIDIYKLPAKQLFEIRQKLRGKALIKVVKKRILMRALKEAGLADLSNFIQGSPAILMADENPFKLARLIEENKSRAPAKAGDIAPNDIVVRAGPTPLTPGPVIGELQRLKIPAAVEGGKISIKEDTLVAKSGDVISKELANMLAKLGIEPMEIGLNLLAVWENGTVYKKDILFKPVQKWMEEFQTAYLNAFNLGINAGYPTKDNIKIFISKAFNEARSLALNSKYMCKETVKVLLAEAYAHAQALKNKTG